MKDLTLAIDTADNAKTTVSLKAGSEMQTVSHASGEHNSQQVLPLIEQILKESNHTLNELTAIEVNPGPGSFTGVRVGVTVANILGWLLKIPVNGKPVEFPRYAPSKFDE